MPEPLKLKAQENNITMEFNEGLEPVSPTGQYLSSSVMSVSIIAVLEFEVPINDLQIMSLVKDVFLPINPRFSSIMIDDRNSGKQWRNVEVKLEDHVHVPIFPTTTGKSSDEYFDDYLTDIATKQFSQNKPLWEIHIIKYPTSNAAGNLIFKLHHALGDGYSLMGAFLSCLQRADNPSLPPTFPSHQRNGSNVMPPFLSSLLNTISDFAWSTLKNSSFAEDDRSPIRSGDEGVEFRPIKISTMTFSLDLIKHIKTSLGVTINDVITGIIFFGIRLYMKEISQKSSKSNSTALVLMNTRMISGYKSIQEMLKPDAEAPWGNRVGMLLLPIPNFTDPKTSNPLEFIWKAHKIIKRKRSSFGLYLTGKLWEITKQFRGPEAAARIIYSTMKNSSICISNMMGPVEQMALSNHPVKGLYFMSAGMPQSLNITIVSYMGNLRVAFGTEKDFLDPHKFKSCMENAFEMILKAAHEISTGN